MGKVKKPLKYMPKGKGIQRKQEAEVKKHLRKFAYAEYTAKKPLELRLLQLKPQIVFKKGTILPHLLIRALKQTSYVIYLDYGEEIRYYFYSNTGLSLGASTYPKTAKMLSEMQGKANTLVKIPKVDQSTIIDTESMNLQKEFKKIASRIRHKYQKTIRKLPICIVKDKKLKTDGIRIGIGMGQSTAKEFIHISNVFLTETTKNWILLREIFPHVFPVRVKDPEFYLLATIWAFSEDHSIDKPDFVSLVQQINPISPLARKVTEWLSKVFGKKIQGDRLKQDHFARFLIESISLIFKFDNKETYKLW
jgi:hypothetical protein